MKTPLIMILLAILVLAACSPPTVEPGEATKKPFRIDLGACAQADADAGRMKCDGEYNILSCEKQGTDYRWANSQACPAGEICYMTPDDNKVYWGNCGLGCIYSFVDQTGVLRNLIFPDGAKECADSSTAGVCAGGVISYTTCSSAQVCSDGECVSCVDSDGGSHYMLAGTVARTTSAGEQLEVDTCVQNADNTWSVTEYTCDAMNTIQSELLPCDVGQKCDGGRCRFFPGTLKINSDPPGALVYLNNGAEPIGTTNLQRFVIGGDLPITLRKAGYEDYPATARVTGGQIEVLDAVLTSNPVTGTLEVTNNNAFYVNFYVDGSSSATFQLSPGETKTVELTVGPHYVRLAKNTLNDNKHYLELIEIAEGQTKSISPLLEPSNGKTIAYFWSEPLGADVYVDSGVDSPGDMGVYLGKTPISALVEPFRGYKMTLEGFKGDSLVAGVNGASLPDRYKGVVKTLVPANPGEGQIYINVKNAIYKTAYHPATGTKPTINGLSTFKEGTTYVAFYATGYTPIFKTFDVVEGESSQTYVDTLATELDKTYWFIYGTEGLKVYVDGVLVGASPGLFSAEANRDHQLQVKNDAGAILQSAGKTGGGSAPGYTHKYLVVE